MRAWALFWFDSLLNDGTRLSIKCSSSSRASVFSFSFWREDRIDCWNTDSGCSSCLLRGGGGTGRSGVTVEVVGGDGGEVSAADCERLEEGGDISSSL